jgi:hypothetical protein
MALVTVSNNSLTAVTALPASVPTGALTLIKSITASSSASISFVDGASGVVLDDTYKSYVFKFINIHHANDAADFQFQVDTGTNTNYNQTITSMGFVAEHDEADSATTLAAHGGSAILHQETVFQDLGRSLGNDADQSLNGELHLFEPSNTTFAKHFIGVINEAGATNQSVQRFVSGYINTTTAITTIQFKADSGNIDSGIIKLYGVS